MKILYEDENIIVCLKEAGLAVENANISRPDLVSMLKKYLKSPYLGLVHRLDMPVEGLLVFGKNQKATGALSKQLGDSTLNKNYLALVCGKPSEKSSKLVDYLATEKIQGKSSGKKAIIVKEGDKDAKKAILNYERLGSRTVENMEISLLDVQIETGRFHQIRAQLSNAGFPIIADMKYGTDISNEIAKTLGIKNVALFANRLSLVHPISGKRMDFEYKPDVKIIEEIVNG